MKKKVVQDGITVISNKLKAVTSESEFLLPILRKFERDEDVALLSELRDTVAKAQELAMKLEQSYAQGSSVDLCTRGRVPGGA